MTKLLRKIDGWRFELPLALVLALALGFMLFVMPARLIARLLAPVGLGQLAQPVVAAAAAVLGGGVALALMLGAGQAARVKRRAAEAVDDRDDEPEPQPMPFRPIEESVAATAAAEPVVRVRRADAHPDAPPRAPILATRDLGEPFMDFAPESASEAEPTPIRPAILDADFVELPDSPAAESPSPAATTRPERSSIADMMARLDAGMMRRSGPAVPPRDARPALRDALVELNRLAARQR